VADRMNAQGDELLYKLKSLSSKSKIDMGPQYKVETKINPKKLLRDAISKYPILGKSGLMVSNEVGNPDIGMLEFWGPGEPGSKTYKRPKDVPIDALGVQINNPKVRPIDILADLASHWMVRTDPKMGSYYDEFKKSITPEQRARMKRDYQYAIENSNESRGYDEWLENTRMPAYFRGYTFNQWPAEFNNAIFTPEQIGLFNKVRKYLGVSNSE